MASDLNNVTLIGRLTADPVLQYLAQSGMAVASFSLANNYYVASKNGDEVNFFEVTAFGKQAETVSKYLKKGKQVAVYGTLRQERWQDKETGTNRSKIKIIMNQMQMLGGTGQSGGYSEGEGSHEYSNENRQPPSYNNNAGNASYNQAPPRADIPMDSEGFGDEDDVPF